jgi:ELWxxDGT repeat protein
MNTFLLGRQIRWLLSLGLMVAAMLPLVSPAPATAAAPIAPQLFYEIGADENTIRASCFGQLPGLTLFEVYVQGYYFWESTLWRTDGTTMGTRQLAFPDGLEALGGPCVAVPTLGQYFFSARYADSGTELWRSDGETVTMVSDLLPGPGTGLVSRNLVELQGVVYFVGHNGADQRGLWRSDGTLAGTVPVKLFAPGNEIVSALTLSGNYLYFVTGGNSLGKDILYRSDGTATGTIPVLDQDGSQPTDLLDVQGTLHFRLIDTAPGAERWQPGTTDGTPAGTRLIDTFFGSPSSIEAIAFQGQYIFGSGYTEADGLWKIAGEEAVKLADLGAVHSMTVLANRLYIESSSGFWQSDGSPAGTQPVAMANPPRPVRGISPIAVDGMTYFTATTPQGGSELWRLTTDLSDAEQVGDINPGERDSEPRDFFVLHHELFFVADGPKDEYSVQLYKLIDPTQRVTTGLLALYDFEEGTGNVIHDTSGAGTALHLRVARAYNHRWVEGGLRVRGGTVLRSRGAASKINQAAKKNNALTVEAWVQPDDVQQFSARMVTLSPNATVRNLTLSQGSFTRQERSEAIVRYRHSGSAGSGDELSGGRGTLTSKLVHIVFVLEPRDRLLVATLYIDWVRANLWANDGQSLANWNLSYPLLLGNEALGGRGWQGTYYLVAFYDRPLSAAEVVQNYNVGP